MHNNLGSGTRAMAIRKSFASFRSVATLSVVFVAMLALFAGSAMAQIAGTGAISGTVTDPTGAVVAGATVTATDTSTNVQTVRTTTGCGRLQHHPTHSRSLHRHCYGPRLRTDDPEERHG